MFRWNAFLSFDYILSDIKLRRRCSGGICVHILSGSLPGRSFSKLLQFKSRGKQHLTFMGAAHIEFSYNTAWASTQEVGMFTNVCVYRCARACVCARAYVVCVCVRCACNVCACNVCACNA